MERLDVGSPTTRKGKNGEAMKAFQAAEDIQAEGKMQEAISAYEGILRKYPDLGWAPAYAGGTRKSDTTLKGEILIRIARCYSQIGDDDSAIQTYLKLISSNPNSIEASQAVSLMTSLYAQRYRFDEVIAMSRHLAQQFPETATAAMALYRVAGYLYSRGKFKEAIREYENFLNQFPESTMRSTAFNQLVRLYTKEGMFREAERRLIDRLAQDPKDTYMLRELARVYQKQGEYDKAFDLYQEILDVNPNDVYIYEKLGELYAEKGNKEKAIAEWFKITRSAPGQYSRYQMLAYILKSHGFYDQAAAEYRKAIKLQPQLSHLYIQLADVYVVKKQFGPAIDAYLDALIEFPVNHPSRSDITTAMLELCELEGLYGKAISRLKAHLIRSPDSIPVLLTLADVYFHQDNLDSSLQQFRTIASLYPDKGEILLDRARTLERERQSDHAIEFYQTILDLFPIREELNPSPTSLHALMRIGQLRAQLHQPQAAIASLRTLLSQTSSKQDNTVSSLRLTAYTTIADIYLQQMHDVQAALSAYTKAKREGQRADPRRKTQDARQEEKVFSLESSVLSSESFKSYILFLDLDLKIVECYHLMGRYDTAENVLGSIPTEYRTRTIAAQIAKLRGDCYFSRGDFDNALMHYQEATRGYMNEDWVNDALDTVALIKEYSDQGLQSLLGIHAQVERLRKLGQYDEALALYTSAAKEYSTDRIQLEMGDLLALQMKAREAISAYEQLIRSDNPLASEAQFRIAEVYWQQLRDPERAIEEYSVLIEKYPESILVADARKQIRRLASENASSDILP